MIDPLMKRKKPFRPTRPAPIPAFQGPADMAERMALLLELAPLKDLAWEPLQIRFEAVMIAMAGGEGCSADLPQQLRRWAANYRDLRPEIRAFYENHARDHAAAMALWTVLDGSHLPGPVRGDLYRLWEDDHGAPPDGIDITPRPKQLAPARN